MTMDARRPAQSASCLARSGEWRREASHLRALADQARLPPDARAILRLEANAAERQADLWLNAAIEEGGTGATVSA